mmetsp:Transcript_19889/g.79292  ORF Transcript_19889/g.79292 Transcript_19889/m.79292 type:complete len:205 (+) Transcript_19889:73-687(+)
MLWRPHRARRGAARISSLNSALPHGRFCGEGRFFSGEDEGEAASWWVRRTRWSAEAAARLSAEVSSVCALAKASKSPPGGDEPARLIPGKARPPAGPLVSVLRRGGVLTRCAAASFAAARRSLSRCARWTVRAKVPRYSSKSSLGVGVAAVSPSKARAHVARCASSSLRAAVSASTRRRADRANSRIASPNATRSGCCCCCCCA